MKQVVIDIREADSSKRAGKGNYNLFLTEALLQDTSIHWTLLTDKTDSIFSNTPNSTVVPILKKGLAWHFAVRKLIYSSGYDAYLAMTSFITPLLIFKKIKTYVFIHDLICFLFPKNHPRKAVLIEQLFLPRLINKVEGFFTVSMHTMQDFIQIFPKQDSKKLFRAECGFVASNNQMQSNQNSALSENYILSVSSILPRKNFETLIKAFSQLSPSHQLKLKIVGSVQDTKYFEKLKRLVLELNLTDRVDFVGFVNSSELSELYLNAKIFVYPSLYEGFGLPLLEAMSFGIPIVSSNSSSLPEVGSEAVVYFNPSDVKDLQQKIDHLLLNPEFVAELKDNYSAQLQKYTWQNSAEKVLAILK